MSAVLNDVRPETGKPIIRDTRGIMNTASEQSFEQEINPDVVEAELSRLLSERKFAGAPQMSAFLKYIVRETLSGRAERIKAYSVGVDALGKPDTFDAQTDPSVRVLALRLRKTLKTIYTNPVDNLAIIELRVGTYVPEFYKPTAAYGQDLTPSGNSSAGQSGAAALKMGSLSPASEESGEDCVVKDNIALKPVRDSDTVNQRSLGDGFPSESRNPSTGDILQRDTHPVAGGIIAQWPKLDKWTVVIGVTLLAVAWQISITYADKNGVAVGSLPLLPAATSYMGAAGEVTDLASETEFLTVRPSGPIVYIDLLSSQPDLNRQLIHLLSSSFVQAGTVSVVRRDDSSADQKRAFWPGEYQLVVNGFTVDDNMRVDAQLVRLSNGEMLHADTVTVDGFEQSFSSQDLSTIESMATGIVSLDGPLYRDFCSHVDSAANIDCKSS
jgi:hypothetical protein